MPLKRIEKNHPRIGIAPCIRPRIRANLRPRERRQRGHCIPQDRETAKESKHRPRASNSRVIKSIWVGVLSFKGNKKMEILNLWLFFCGMFDEKSVIKSKITSITKSPELSTEKPTKSLIIKAINITRNYLNQKPYSPHLRKS